LVATVTFLLPYSRGKFNVWVKGLKTGLGRRWGISPYYRERAKTHRYR
jgi:hypothetical protein